MPKQFIYLFRVMLKGFVGFVGRVPLAQGFLLSSRFSSVFDSVNTLDLSPTVQKFGSWQHITHFKFLPPPKKKHTTILPTALRRSV
jgi:hypothetical protein